MKIKKLQIKNFKSIVDLELINPNPFSVFVGPNASGKSNIFEAIQFLNSLSQNSTGSTVSEFGGFEEIQNYKTKTPSNFSVEFYDFTSSININFSESQNSFEISPENIKRYSNESMFQKFDFTQDDYKCFFDNHHRYFINNDRIPASKYKDDYRLNSSCTNLEKVLKRLLKDETKREEIMEWIQLFIPGFDKIEIASEPLSSSDNILIYEKGTTKPFPKALISDGTYNVLCLLTACYQSDEPQFLCIEEPENGLNPFVVRELVNLFRDRCDEGHYIWINTHSQSLVSRLKEEELILVDKIDGETKVQQIPKGKTQGMRMDEAWFTKLLGGGTPF